jgi:predicted nucleotidyltransferase
MNLEFYPEEKLKEQLSRIIFKYIDKNKWSVFLFGSRVKGNNSPSSDIDIGIEGPESVPPEIMFKIREEIEEIPTLYSFDIVDFNTVTEDFRKKAKKEAEYVG